MTITPGGRAPATVLALLLASLSPVAMAQEPAPAALSSEELLAAHNRYRAEVGVPPLVWSEELATSAQAWARDLASRGSFEHSSTPHGENLWMGTSGRFSSTRMVELWGEEKRDYVHGIFPKVTTGGVVGHYTQMVWRSTLRVGCGLSSSSGQDILVCHYDPPGNFYGKAPY